MHLAAHLLFERGDVGDVICIPQRQRDLVGLPADIRVITPQFLLRRRLVVVREITQEEEREHIVAEVIRIHGPAQLVGDTPQRVAELLLIGFSHRANSIQ